MKEKELKQYFRKLKKRLKYTYSSEQVNKIIKQLQSDSNNYFQENPNASFEDFIEEFGDADSLSLDFLENAQDLSLITGTAPIRKKLFKVTIGIIIFIVLLDQGLWLLDHIEQETTEIISTKTVIGQGLPELTPVEIVNYGR